MTNHAPLPVKGYQAQPSDKIKDVNRNKDIEERALRILDELAMNPDIDPHWLEIGRRDIEKGFMAVNRSIFQPGRVTLSEDAS